MNKLEKKYPFTCGALESLVASYTVAQVSPFGPVANAFIAVAAVLVSANIFTDIFGSECSRPCQAIQEERKDPSPR